MSKDNYGRWSQEGRRRCPPLPLRSAGRYFGAAARGVRLPCEPRGLWLRRSAGRYFPLPPAKSAGLRLRAGRKSRGLWPPRAGRKSAGEALRPRSRISERSAGDRVRPRSKISGAAGSNDRRDRSAGEALRPRPRTSGMSGVRASEPSRILSSFRPSSATRGCGVFRASGSRGGRPRRAAGVGRERGGRAPESAASKDLGSEGCGVTKGGPGSSKKWRRMPTGRASGVTAFNGDSAATPRLTGGSASSFDWRGVLSDGSRAGGLPSVLASGCRRRAWPRGSRSRGLSRGRRRSIAGLPRPAGGVEGRRCRGCASAHSGKVTMLLGAGGRPKGCN